MLIAQNVMQPVRLELQQIVMLVIDRIMNQLQIQIMLLLNFQRIAVYVIQQLVGKALHLIIRIQIFL